MARTFTGYLRECNFLNQLDNCLDPVHATILHGREVNGARENPERQESPEFEVLADDLFASYVARRPGPIPGKEWHREVSYTPPILVIHDGGSLPGDPAAYFADVAWRMPIDDYNTYSFILKFFPFRDGKSTIAPKRNEPRPPPLLRGTRRQFDMTTVTARTPLPKSAKEPSPTVRRSTWVIRIAGSFRCASSGCRQSRPSDAATTLRASYAI
jgi:hypothetical protein